MMRRSFFAATAAALALGGIVTAAPAVAQPRCLFQGDWNCEGTAAIQRAAAKHLGRAGHLRRLDATAAALPGRRRPSTVPAIRPAAGRRFGRGFTPVI
jgi:hypothetical protein